VRLTLFAFPVLAVLSGPVAAVVGGDPRVDGPMLVIVPPWANAGEIVARAGGRLVGPIRAPMAVFAAATDTTAPDATEGFVRRVRNEGAWWVSDGTALAAICGVG